MVQKSFTKTDPKYVNIIAIFQNTMLLKEKTYIRGLHVYKVDVAEGDVLTAELDEFWMWQNPHRYSILVRDSLGRPVTNLFWVRPRERFLEPPPPFGSVLVNDFCTQFIGICQSCKLSSLT